MRCIPTRGSSSRAWMALATLLVSVLFIACREQRPIRAGATPPPPPPPPPVESTPESIPAFPWPPPPASATEVLPNSMFEQHTHLSTLGNLNDALIAGLQTTGYFEKSYYAVPRGFALATRLEQISDDGTPKPPPDRWSAAAPHVESFSIKEYLHALLTDNPGYYRVVVFVVTDVPFSESGSQASMSEAQSWLTKGSNTLPASMASAPFGQNTVCTALIYEFSRSAGKEPGLLQPGHLDAHTHLVKSGLWTALGGTL